MNLYIHAGLHKTATTAFQEICRHNRTLLKELGVLYPELQNEPQHSHLMWRVQSEGISTLENYLCDCMVQARGSCHSVLLSGEDFENCIVDTCLAIEVETAARSAGFDKICWIIVTRNTADYAASIYSEKSRHGIVLNYETIALIANSRGVFYASNSAFDYIFVLNFSSHAPRFRKAIAGDLVEFDMASFVADFPGACLLRQLLGKDKFTQFRETRALTHKINNERLSPFEVELRYLATFLGVSTVQHDRRIRTLFGVLFYPLIQLRVAKRNRIHTQYFGSQ